MKEICRLCRQSALISVLDFGAHPIAHRFLTDPSETEYEHSVHLCFCENCGHIQLVDAIPPEQLYTAYHWLSAWKPQPHVPRLVSLIEHLPELKTDARVVEVGCNDGSFLQALRERGYSNLLGIEPAQDAAQAARRRGFETRGEYFSPALAGQIVAERGKCDLLIMRQVLEHIGGLGDVGEAIRMLLRPGGHILVEVPNFDFGLAALDYSAIWEEHVNQFTFPTLSRFLGDWGIRVTHSETANFCGEALIVLGENAVSDAAIAHPSEYLTTLRDKVVRYQKNWNPFRHKLVDYLTQERAKGMRIVIYGAGARASTLINYAGIAPYLEFIADDQPEKQGKYMPGSRLPILPGNAIEEREIGVCLLAVNAESEETVIRHHPAFERKGGQFASLHPPSPRLLQFMLQSVE